MARNSIAAAKAELFALLSTAGVPLVAGVTAVYDHEPFAGQGQKPVCITISTAGMSPDFYLIALRIYQTCDVDVAQAQANLDGLILTVDAMMSSGFGPSEWAVEYRDDITALVATQVFQVGRQD